MIFSELESGHSLEGHPIPVFKTDIKAPKYLYLIGGVHGDEVEGVYVLKELFSWLKLEHSLKDLPMIVIPILNILKIAISLLRLQESDLHLQSNLSTGEAIHSMHSQSPPNPSSILINFKSMKSECFSHP